MDFLNSWLQGIIIAVIVATIIEMILPNSNSKKYVKVVLGVYVVFNIITPVVNQFFNSDFELSSIINMEEYAKKMQTYEVANENIDISKANEENIKQIYASNLKNDMKAKLEEKEYLVKELQVEVENDESYTIKSISMLLEKKKEKAQEEKIENRIIINEIEKVNIQIGEKKEEVNTEVSSKITEKEKEEVKQYLSSVYEIKEKQINIY